MANNFSDAVALWRFEQSALTVDSEGGNTLTDVNSVGYDTSDYKEGACCADFEDNSNDYFKATNSSLDSDFPFKYGQSNYLFSIGFWFKPESFPSKNHGLFALYNSNTSKRTIMLYFNSSGQLRYSIGYNSGASAEILYTDTGNNLSTGTWYYIGATYNRSTKAWTLYVTESDGTEVINQSGTSTNTMSICDVDLNIGTFSTNTSVTTDGKMDEMVVFGGIKSDSDFDDMRNGVYGAVASTSLAPTTSSPTTPQPTTSAPTTIAPTTPSPTTSAPTTISPTTVPPTTLAPTSLPPTTPGPTTHSPTTHSPTTPVPTSLAPTTLGPTTIGPTTIAPTSLPPTTLVPTTLLPTTLGPTTLPPPTTSPPIPEVRRRGINDFGFSFRDRWR